MNDPTTTRGTSRWRTGILRDGPEANQLVVKFGGSLLRRSDWPTLLRSLVEMRRGRAIAVVVGGGAAVDSIRRIDAAASLDPAVAHRLAIDAMGINARHVAESMAWRLSVNVPCPGDPCVVDVPAWLDAGGRFARLPVGWHVTSDSIAAFIAAETASDLVLAKSVPPPAAALIAESLDTESLVTPARAGWVDRWFATAAARDARIEWAAPVSPTTNHWPAGRRALRAAASRRRGSRPSSRRPPRAG